MPHKGPLVKASGVLIDFSGILVRCLVKHNFHKECSLWKLYFAGFVISVSAPEVGGLCVSRFHALPVYRGTRYIIKI